MVVQQSVPLCKMFLLAFFPQMLKIPGVFAFGRGHSRRVLSSVGTSSVNTWPPPLSRHSSSSMDVTCTCTVNSQTWTAPTLCCFLYLTWDDGVFRNFTTTLFFYTNVIKSWMCLLENTTLSLSQYNI